MLHVEGSYGVAYAASLEMSKVVIIILIPCTEKKNQTEKVTLYNVTLLVKKPKPELANYRTITNITFVS